MSDTTNKTEAATPRTDTVEHEIGAWLAAYATTDMALIDVGYAIARELDGIRRMEKELAAKSAELEDAERLIADYVGTAKALAETEAQCTVLRTELEQAKGECERLQSEHAKERALMSRVLEGDGARSDKPTP